MIEFRRSSIVWAFCQIRWVRWAAGESPYLPDIVMRVLGTVAGEKWRLHLVRVASGGYAWWERHRTVSIWVVSLGEIQTCRVRLADLSGGWAWGNGNCLTERGKGGRANRKQTGESKRERDVFERMQVRGHGKYMFERVKIRRSWV